jgi:hypothetical protein
MTATSVVVGRGLTLASVCRRNPFPVKTRPCPRLRSPWMSLWGRGVRGRVKWTTRRFDWRWWGLVRVRFEWGLFAWTVGKNGRHIFMKADSEVYFTRADTSSSEFRVTKCRMSQGNFCVDRFCTLGRAGINGSTCGEWLTGFYDGHGSSWKTCAAPNGRPGLGSKPLSSRVGLCPWDRRTRRNTEQRQLRFRERRRFHCLWLVKVIARGARSSSALECTSLRILTVQESMQPEGEWHAEN